MCLSCLHAIVSLLYYHCLCLSCGEARQCSCPSCLHTAMQLFRYCHVYLLHEENSRYLCPSYLHTTMPPIHHHHLCLSCREASCHLCSNHCSPLCFSLSFSSLLTSHQNGLSIGPDIRFDGGREYSAHYLPEYLSKNYNKLSKFSTFFLSIFLQQIKYFYKYQPLILKLVKIKTLNKHFSKMIFKENFLIK